MAVRDRMQPDRQRGAMQPDRQRGAMLLAMLLLILIGSLALLADRNPFGYSGRWQPDPAVRLSLMAARVGLTAWASERVLHHPLDIDSTVPPGLLPYPDRDGDQAYDDTSDCPSVKANLGNGLLRLGRIPRLGWRAPCREKAETPVDAMALAALDIHGPGGEPFWFAGAIHLFDRATGAYPVTTPSALLKREDGWLTVCDQAGHLLTDRAAFVVIAPGRALAGQSRNGSLPPASSFLDAASLRGPPPCDSARESNYDGNLVYVAADGSDPTRFNDAVAYVTADAFASSIAKSLLAWLGERYLRPYRLSTGSFPFAASSLSDAGVCEWGLLDGDLPARGGECPALGSLPGFLKAKAGPFMAELSYRRSADGFSAELQFKACAIVLHVDAVGSTIFPERC